MIVVFVVDTSPSMGEPLDVSSGSMSRLDLAKMAVESLAKGLRKRVSEHNGQLQQETSAMQKSLHNLGLGFCPNDQFLLLSTGRQFSDHPGTAACGAGGRLLVGYGDSVDFTESTSDTPPLHGSHGGFDRSLKQLQVTEFTKSTNERVPFPEDGGGATGLNVALSAGLQLMSRYRLKTRTIENFGMGRLPSQTMLAPGGAVAKSLQPACLVLLTDGECLRKPASEGGGSLQLQTRSMPLHEFYQEPFRWDQRIFCLGVGAPEGVPSSQYLHPSLQAVCEVTGGCHTMLRSSTSLSQLSDMLLKLLAPPRPREMPVPDPFRSTPPSSNGGQSSTSGLFVNGGPICCFQGLEVGMHGEPSPTRRAMLLHVPFEQQTTPPKDTPAFSAPMWCIPEAFFPSKKLDTLPPRLAQPLLTFSTNFSMVGSRIFDPGLVIKLLQRLDQLTLANRKQSSQVKLLHRDVYICEWLSQDGKSGSPPRGPRGMEYLPVCVRGAGRPLVEGDEHNLSIGILHIPSSVTPLSYQTSGARYCTLTLLPPEPHILLPLLVKAAEAEHRQLRKSPDVARASGGGGATAGLIQMQSSSTSGPKLVVLDEHWRSDFRAYMFRIPLYYHNALKRCLRPILPPSAHSLLHGDGMDSLLSQCFSKTCMSKIRTGEQIARESNERLERQESELRRRGMTDMNKSRQGETNKNVHPIVGYGQYDPRSTTTGYLAALRTLPAPWHVGVASRTKDKDVAIVEASSSQDAASDTASVGSIKDAATKTVVDILGDLPSDCLVPYYESRRRWIFGGSGLTTRGLHVEGVNNDGSNAHHYDAQHSAENESILSVAGVGVSTLNQTTTAEMGNFRERLLWSRAPMVGSGSNAAAGVSATTAPDGSPLWSVDDDALPMSYFDPKTGEFTDSVQTRVRARLNVNFGNPYRDKRGDSIVPEAFLDQSPSFKKGKDGADNGPQTPPGSPPHDSFTSTEGEGEAVFAEQPIRKPVARHHPQPQKPEAGKRDREEDESSNTTSSPTTPDDTPRKKPKLTPEPPPPKPSTPQPTPQRRPPPPKPPQKKAPPPPPPPRPPPRPPAEKRPRPSDVPVSKQAIPPPPKLEAAVSGKTNAPPPPKLEATVSGKMKAAAPSPAPANEAGKEKSTPALDLQSPGVKPKVNLPQGWMCVWSKSQKRWYFFDTKTNKSVWQWPPPGGL